MNDNKDYLAKDIARHKPHLFMPIFNTIIGILFLVLMIRVTIYNHVHVGYLILVIFLILIFVGGSWYTSFFFKRKNKKLTQDFEEETKLLFEAMYELKKGTYIEPKNKVRFEVIDEITPIKHVSYDLVKRTFIPKENFQIFINCGTNCCGLLIDPTTLKATGFQGMSPYSLWQKKHISLPSTKEASIKLIMDGYEVAKKLTLKIMKETDTYYDAKTGVFAVGDLRKTTLDENIQIGENVIVSIYDEEIKCIYVQLEPNLFHK